MPMPIILEKPSAFVRVSLIGILVDFLYNALSKAKPTTFVIGIPTGILDESASLTQF